MGVSRIVPAFFSHFFPFPPRNSVSMEHGWNTVVDDHNPRCSFRDEASFASSGYLPPGKRARYAHGGRIVLS